jgi:prepilin-type N-terminal cleavage/methylation domain-containing protein
LHRPEFVPRGFSLVEVVVAATLVAGALATLAWVAAAGVESGFVAGTRTTTVLLASQKMEELRTLSWSALAAGSAGPPEYFDGDGVPRCLGSPTPCAEAVYVRRWSAAPAEFSASVLIVTVDASLVAQRHGSTRLVTARASRARGATSPP